MDHKLNTWDFSPSEAIGYNFSSAIFYFFHLLAVICILYFRRSQHFFTYMYTQDYEKKKETGRTWVWFIVFIYKSDTLRKKGNFINVTFYWKSSQKDCSRKKSNYQISATCRTSSFIQNSCSTSVGLSNQIPKQSVLMEHLAKHPPNDLQFSFSYEIQCPNPFHYNPKIEKVANIK